MYPGAQVEATLDPRAGLAAVEDTASDGAAAQSCERPAAKATAHGDGRPAAAKRPLPEVEDGAGGTASGVDQDGQDAHRAKRPRFWQQQQYTQVPEPPAAMPAIEMCP